MYNIYYENGMLIYRRNKLILIQNKQKSLLLTLTFDKYSKIDDILILALLYFGGPFYAGPKRRKAVF